MYVPDLPRAALVLLVYDRLKKLSVLIDLPCFLRKIWQLCTSVILNIFVGGWSYVQAVAAMFVMSKI